MMKGIASRSLPWAATIVVCAAQSFTPTGSMAIPRFSHAATTLADGRILVTGGQQFFGASATSTAEIYNPATGSWRYTHSPMNMARYDHSATRLADGRVLIAGGDNSSIKLATAEIFDPVTETFTYTGTMNSTHSGGIGIRLNDGRVLVIGKDWSPACDIYHPATGTWSAAAPMPAGLVGNAATLLPDGRVLVAGGADSGYVTRSSVSVYDPVSNSWQSLSPMLVARQALTAVALANGKVLIAGGSDIFSGDGYTTTELYDPAAASGTGQSMFTGSLSNARRGHSALRLANGDVLVTGGTHGEIGSLRNAEIFGFATGNWSSAGNMLEGRQAHSMTLLSDGDVLVAGGILHDSTYTNPAFLGSAELWNPGCQSVQIDIKPGTFPNSINLGSNGTIPVAILSSAGFDSTTVDPLSIRLAGAAVKIKGSGTPQYSAQDINADGRIDLVVHVLTEALQLTSTDVQAVLRATTFSGQCISGIDTVRIVP